MGCVQSKPEATGGPKGSKQQLPSNESGPGRIGQGLGQAAQAGGPQGAGPALSESNERSIHTPGLSYDAVRPNNSGEVPAGAGQGGEGVAASSMPYASGNNDGVMRVIRLLQELLSTSNDRHKAQLGVAMATMCAKMQLAWACITVLTPSGQMFQHVAQAVAQPEQSHWGRSGSLAMGEGGSRFRSGNIVSTGSAQQSKGTISRQSSSSSISPAQGTGHIIELGLSDAMPVHGSGSSIELLVRSGAQPLTALLGAAAQPGTAAYEQAVDSLPSDWARHCRQRNLRSLMCLPVMASKGGGLIGALSFGATEAMVWEEAWWMPSVQLITGWAAGALVQTRSAQRAAMFEGLSSANDMEELAAVFVRGLPDLLADEGLGKVEARVALVSSKLCHAIMFSAPLDPEPAQHSASLGLRHRLGSSGAAGSSLGSAVVIGGGNSGGVLMVGSQPFEVGGVSAWGWWGRVGGGCYRWAGVMSAAVLRTTGVLQCWAGSCSGWQLLAGKRMGKPVT